MALRCRRSVVGAGRQAPGRPYQKHRAILEPSKHCALLKLSTHVPRLRTNTCKSMRDVFPSRYRVQTCASDGARCQCFSFVNKKAPCVSLRDIQDDQVQPVVTLRGPCAKRAADQSSNPTPIKNIQRYHANTLYHALSSAGHETRHERHLNTDWHILRANRPRSVVVGPLQASNAPRNLRS